MMTTINYADAASAYAQHRRVHPEVLRRLLAAVGPTSTVLEVGCGTGNYIDAIREQLGCPCHGIDPSAEMLARATAPIRFSQGNAESLNFPPASFDLVYSVDVIHHVSDRPRHFREAARVLRPGGKICTVTDSEWIIRNRQPLAEYFPETIAVDLARYPTLANLHASMSDAGFEKIKEDTVEFVGVVSDVGPYRDKAYSCLRLIAEDPFQRGLARLETDFSAGPVAWVPRYCLLWGSTSD
jgi:SAM-dependent methyltransferase